MGCGSSLIRAECHGTIESKAEESTQWKQKLSKREAREIFVDDGTIPKDCSNEILELRTYLDDHLLLSKVSKFAEEIGAVDLLMCWAEILEFKSIDSASFDYQLSKAQHIYRKYLKDGSGPVKLKGIEVSSERRTHVEEILARAAAAETEALPKNIFDFFHQAVLTEIYKTVFVDFKQSEEYASCAAALRSQYNKVGPDDFEYIKELGQGGFGIVVHCKKKSTGKHYAMKIQTKLGLLGCYPSNGHRVNIEKDALMACRHPFIISMDYAFQTKSLVMMVMDLGLAGTLADSLQASGNGRMSEDRVRFYSAEIILALFHMHRLGMIYRDLKPANVILNHDGHIKLVDLGGIVDVEGRVLGRGAAADASSMGGIFAPVEGEYLARQQTSSGKHHGPMMSLRRLRSAASSAQLFISSRLSPSNSRQSSLSNMDMSNPHINLKNDSGVELSQDNRAPILRAKSIMGTCGFMAPEMLVLMSQETTSKSAYDNTVDYWSLGVTMYNLLSGELPFHHNHVAGFVRFLSTRDESPNKPAAFKSRPASNYSPESNPSFQIPISNASKRAASFYNYLSSIQSDSGFEVAFTTPPPQRVHPAYKDFLNLSEAAGVSPNAMSIIRCFLEVDSSKRLGSGLHGVAAIKRHEYFDGLSWNKLAQRLLVPPLVETKTVAATDFDGDKTYDTFKDFILQVKSPEWLLTDPRDSDQKYFEHWDFTSSSVIKLEMGVSNKALEEADARYKIALTPVKFRAGVNILSKIASSFSQGDDSIIAFPETKSDQSGKKSPRGKPPGENVMEILRKNKSRGSLFVSDDGDD